MIVSSLSNPVRDAESAITPAMVRGLFLIWQSELQRGKPFIEIREFDSRTSIAGSFSRGTFGIPEDTVEYASGSDSTDWGNDLPDADSW
jgi:hypothetical protein